MIRQVLRWGIWLILIIFILRVFALQVKIVDEFNMSSTILPGDRVVIEKFSTGLRFPTSVLGLPGTKMAYIDLFRIPIFRLPALRLFKDGDIVAYNDPRLVDKPIDRNNILISRIAGLPGDTIMIKDKRLIVNKNIVIPPKTTRRLYRVVTDGSEIPLDFLKKNNIQSAEKVPEVPMFDINLDTIAYQKLKAESFVKKIRPMKMYSNDSSTDYWPYSSFCSWNRDQYGPLIVPYSGQTIDITLQNIDIYRDIISIFEANDLRIDFSGVYINGDIAKTYTIEKDYYFLLDDNRDKPDDSRIIGFVPKDYLLGRVTRVLFSGQSPYKYLPTFRAKRLLKRIR
ncbi:MAG: signal peptidase I [Bacteroidales bacterium]|nr:signal peptidase I [Bacteroidales bacterium]